MATIIDEVKGLYKIIQFDVFRKTEGVTFDIIPVELFSHIDSMDRVLHKHNAVSPGQVDNVVRPWYMHPHQEDNLVVLYGTRYVEIYTPQHGQIERFTVTPTSVYKNDQLITESSAMLVWSENVFHRIISGEEGSASINLAVHSTGFDISNNFDIYDIDFDTKKYKVIREGFKDQMI